MPDQSAYLIEKQGQSLSGIRHHASKGIINLILRGVWVRSKKKEVGKEYELKHQNNCFGDGLTGVMLDARLVSDRKDCIVGTAMWHHWSGITGQ